MALNYFLQKICILPPYYFKFIKLINNYIKYKLFCKNKDSFKKIRYLSIYLFYRYINNYCIQLATIYLVFAI